ncbi:hypothetical protein FHG66_00955 [Rubellimicrobium rubrum]|uniref:Uncharacterized protein n=1 Tax=Rubellimicrobium rubrum TaxID=2585369 RepID=A0A5C4N2H5_9RHOB|nr:hypothetical protein [Rubellimicrobium rubrum]TNC52894.1 hypothetical protein FHG66_00955 [Rubellimicrobium rubrum]
MARAHRPVFLPPAGYRRRRVRDAARLLPVLGVVLLVVPLLWTRSDQPGGVGNSVALIYVFAVWAGLIAGANLLSRLLRRDTEDDADEDGRDPSA